ncbi:WecB/TagA/CpsF family glycosyltransferase [Methylobacterium sp. E-045]|uniref:WecB/TagA/CpsF family glycosyltransferase n=1 Tax=Methylobacterium sp. E-045 TaxID=2836575 RepID=UPI001FB86B72|nr:WecB/TagA/CpsF family glycosyltransferase [Methylobacterium sp. E-045]
MLDQPLHWVSRARSSFIPDFSRKVFCIFGVTFDNVTIDDVLTTIDEAVRTRRQCIITTPNLHFVTRSASDVEFRDSIVRSDLSLVDGMPLVWASRLFQVDVKGRVAGADLFERMRQRRESGVRLKVYVFGGPPGVAKLASDRLNEEDGGLCCVGYRSPGYGSVEELSSSEIIREINASGADFLLVALGAKKGQSWIQQNGLALDVPVISHLGAVINFTAGTIRRAPVPLQNVGLEWAWRISRDPALWRRYLSDGWTALGMATRTSLNAGLSVLRARGQGTSAVSKIAVAETESDLAIEIRGAWNASGLAPLRVAFQAHSGSDKRLSLDVGAITNLDSAAIALLMMLRRHRLDIGQGWHVTGASARLKQICRIYGASDLVD